MECLIREIQLSSESPFINDVETEAIHEPTNVPLNDDDRLDDNAKVEEIPNLSHSGDDNDKEEPSSLFHEGGRDEFPVVLSVRYHSNSHLQMHVIGLLEALNEKQKNTPDISFEQDKALLDLKRWRQQAMNCLDSIPKSLEHE